MRDNRGQAYTLQGVIGAILIASALVVGLQAVSLAPWTADSGDRQTDSLDTQVGDMLAAASDRDALREAATCISGDGDRWPHPAVAAGSADNASHRATLGTLLNRTLDANNHPYEVSVDYPDDGTTDGVNTTVLTPNRTATRSSVSATRQVPIFDSDPVLVFDAARGGCVPVIAENRTLGDWDEDLDREIYVEDQNNDSELYAVVTIRVLAW